MDGKVLSQDGTSISLGLLLHLNVRLPSNQWLWRTNTFITLLLAGWRFWANFEGASKKIQDCIDFNFLCTVIGLESSRQRLNQIHAAFVFSAI